MSPRRVARPAVLRSVPLDRHAVVEASAGTGKTFTLEHLVVELILSADVPIDRILVVTFTEKATNELRLRVRGKLEQLLRADAPAPDAAQVAAGDFWTLDDAAQAKLSRALHAFDGATIATIHAFCQRVLRENAFSSGRLFEEQQVDGRDSFARAMREALRRDVAPDPVRSPWLEAALRTGWSIGRIEELLWKCVQAHGELRPDFDPAALDEALAAFPVEHARRRDGPDVMKSWGMNAQTAKKVGSTLYELALLVERAVDARDAPSFVMQSDEQELDLAHLLDRLPPHLPQPGPTGAACAAALQLARVTPSLTGALVHSILGPVRRELARHKREVGQYDFDDMLALVDEALRGPRAEALVAAMRERWRYALIDEFQDTDETQWSIFRRAFFEKSARGEAAESVAYLVGDPKQSIYRFRGADVETYLQARDDVTQSGGRRVALDTSYRATRALVDAQNTLFDPAAAAPFFTGAITHAPVACGRPDLALVDGEGRELGPVHVFRFEREVALPALATRIAREIRALTDPARPWRLGGSALAPQDVYVLTRTGLEGRIVGTALRAAGVPHAFFKEEGLFQSDEAREIRTLLLAVDDPGDRARRIAAWLTPFFALPLEDVERARDLPAAHPFVARLQTWKALAEGREFERLFESIVSLSGILRREIFFAEGERDLTNYLHVFELLIEQARRTRATLRDLVHALSGLIDKTRLTLDLEGNVQRLESERRAVQIMTIHKAKGLEAAVVFVVGGWSSPGDRDVRVYHENGRRLAWVGSPGADVKTRISTEEREEDQRLMYVALTRARGRLYLPLAVNMAGQRRRGPYDVVNRRLATLVAAGDAAFSVEDVSALRLVPGVAGDALPAGEWQPPEALLHAPDTAAEHARLRERHAGALVTSYTRMRGGRSGARSAWADEPEARRALKAEEAVDEVPAATLRSARASGVFVHEVLERVPLASFAGDFERWRARPEVASLFDETIGVHRVDPEQRGHAEQLVWAAYASPVALPDGASIAGLAGAARVVREMEFVFPLPDARVFVRGTLDLAFEHGQRTYFADWKTDSLGSYDAAALGAHVKAHYADQVQLYALAVVKLLGVRTREEYDARFGGLLYCYLRGMGARGEGLWSTRPSWDDVLAWEAALGARRFPGEGRVTVLSPTGTAKERFLAARGAADPGARAAWHTADPEEREASYLGWEIARCARQLPAGERRAVAALAAACVAATRAGSTRVALDARLRAALEAVGAEGLLAEARALVERARVGDAAAAAVIGRPGDRTPMVVDGEWLYAERMRVLEERFCARVRARLARPTPTDAKAAGKALRAVAEGPPPLTEEQKRAVKTALTSSLVLITGGPGTGKTTIVVALLRALAWTGIPMEAIGIAAPTGKAAQRLQEAIATGLLAAARDIAEAGLAAIAPEPQTLHRLLGWSPSSGRFARHENDRLPQRVVIVDEASMIDLAAMDRLLRALRDDARLVLLGDADQLPSVEAGAVFRDLCAALGAERLSVNLRVARDPSARRIVDAAQAVNAGRMDARFTEAVTTRHAAEELAFEGVEHLSAPWAAVGEALLERWWRMRIASLADFADRVARPFRMRDGAFEEADEAELRLLFEHYGRARLLCATRVRGFATGAEAINDTLLTRLRGGARPRRWRAAELAAGAPVLFERNDYERRLFNGDQGLVLRVDAGDALGARLTAVFPRRGKFVAFPIDALPDLAPAFAMTVHKAQGSEFDHVALVLPESDMPLLTRELLYTAMTRARRSVALVGEVDLLARAVSRAIERHSGVAERLAVPGK